MQTDTSTRATLLILAGGLAIGLGIGAVVFFGLPSLAPAGSAPAPTGPAPMTGASAPDFSLTDAAGQTHTLSALKGQPVLINFWATWCVPCKTEMPAIETAYQKYKAQKLTVLAVDAGEAASDVTSFGQSLGLTFNLLLDPGNSVNDLYQVRAYPSSFFIGADGIVAVLQIGTMSEAQLAEGLAKILPR